MTTRRQLLKTTSALALLAALPRCATVAPRERVAFDAIPRSDYGFDTTADDVVANLDLSGLTILITGCNSGLGYDSMRTLAGAGAHVLGAARTMAKAEEACASVNGKTTPLVCELTNMDSVAACAAAVTDLGKPLDVLMCNAGIMALPELEQVVVNGVTLEKQFVVNHLGHFLLAQLLIESLQDAPAARIVMVSSSGYNLAPEGGIQFDNLSGDGYYQGFKFYGQSKLANILMTKELDRRYFDTGVCANAIHPGVVKTNLGRYINRGRERDPDRPMRRGMKTSPQGAATQVYVAADPRLAGVSGVYFGDCNPEPTTTEYSNDPALAQRLWDVSEELVRPWL